MAIRGVRFQPDTPSAGSWLVNYDQSWQRPMVQRELAELRAKTKISHVVATMAANQAVAYPSPQRIEIERLNLFLRDVAAQGMKAILMVGSPTVTSNAAVAAQKNEEHVGGRRAGDIVNGYRLWWNPPYAGPNHIAESCAFYAAIAAGLADDAYAALEHLTVAGDHRFPFACETNLLFTGSPYRDAVAAYLRAVIDAVHAARPGVKVGVELQNSVWPGGRIYDQAQFAAANVPNADVYESACAWPQPDVATLRTYLPAQKLVIADMGMTTPPTPSPYAAVTHHVSNCALLGLRGYWVWEYRDLGRGGLRKRESGGGAWNEKVCAVLAADAMD